jgi:hypothetical protein
MNDRDSIYLQVAMLWHEVVVEQIGVLVNDADDEEFFSQRRPP